jgi:hypothetical protein
MGPKLARALVVSVEAAVGVFFFITTGQAALLTWELQDVSFNDGGSASGHFTIDPSVLLSEFECSGPPCFKVTDFDVTTVGGSSGVPPFQYTPSTASLQVSVNPFSASFSGQPDVVLQALRFDTGVAFNSIARTLSITSGVEVSSNRTNRSVAHGALVAVPEPSALLCLAVWLALLAVLHLRTRVHEKDPPAFPSTSAGLD